MLRIIYATMLIIALGWSGLSVQSAQAQPGALAWRWAKGFRTSQETGPAAVAVDSIGNTYVAGSFDNYLPLSTSVTLTPQAGTDGFLAKFSPTGTLLWARQLSGMGNQSLRTLKLLSHAGTKQLYLSGNLAAGTVTVDGQTLPIATRDNCAFTACFDLQGQLQWLHPLVSLTGTTACYDLDLDATGNLYMLGTVRGTVPMGAHSLVTPGTAPQEDVQLFWTKLTPTGGVQWIRQSLIAPSVNHEVPATKLQVSLAGDALYLLGGIGDLATSFAGLPLPPALGGTDVLVTKCNGLGQPRWLRRNGGAGGWNTPGRMALDAAGRLVVGLQFSGTIQLGNSTFQDFGPGTYRGAVQVLDTAGTVAWAAATAANYVSDVVCNAGGTTYVFGAGLVMSSYSSQGQLGWTQNSGSPYGSRGAIGSNGHLSMIGVYQVASQFGPFYLPAYSVRGVGPESFYVAQMGAALPTTARPAQAIQSLLLYPMPAHDVVRLPLLPTGTQLVVTDALGRAVRTAQAAATLPVMGLASGLYQVLATAPTGQQWSSRLAIE